MTRRIGIIGGGIVGSTAAFYLSKAGLDVTLIDDNRGQGTKAAAGIICPWLSLRRNKAWYFLVSQGAEFYRQMMADIENEGLNNKNIFQETGTIMIRRTDKRVRQDLDQAEVKRETAPAMGQVKALRPDDIKKFIPIIQSDYPGTWIEGGGRVDGANLVQNLQDLSQKYGCKIFREPARLAYIDPKNDRRVKVLITDQELTFDQLLLSPGPGLAKLLQDLGYQVDLQTQKGQLFKVAFNHPDQAKWPVIMPFGQADIIPWPDGSITIGASHEDGQDLDLRVDLGPLKALKEEAQAWFPDLAKLEAIEIKVGYRAHSSDYSVILGQVPDLDQVWAVSGLGSSGLTSGPYLGYQWAQLLLTGQTDIPEEDFPIRKYIKKA